MQGGYCTSFVDPKWQKSHSCQQKREVQAQVSKGKSDAEILNMSNPAIFDDSDKDNEDFILSDQCDDYVPEIKKEKYEKKPESSNVDMPMPEGYCHRKFVRKYTLLCISCLLSIICLISK